MINEVKNRKSNSGISLIMLVITIVMMAIIVSFAVFSTQNTSDEAKFVSAYSSLKAVKDAVEDAEGLIEINPSLYDDYYFFGNEIKYSIKDESEKEQLAKDCGLESIDQFGERTFLIGKGETEEEKRILENLELKGISNKYVVDLDNDKYYLVNGISHKKSDDSEETETLYEYRDMLMVYELLTK